MHLRYEELRTDGQHRTLGDAEPAPATLVPAVHKAIQILAFINVQPRAVTLSAIIEDTGITKSHCFSILRTLVHHGWLHFNPDLKTCELGTGILRDVSSITLQASPLFVVNSIVQELPLKTGTSCILSEPHADGGFVVVEKANAPGQLEISYPVGHHYPRDTSAHMKALLAWVDAEEVGAWLAGWTPVSYTPFIGHEHAGRVAPARADARARLSGELSVGFYYAGRDMEMAEKPKWPELGPSRFVYHTGDLVALPEE